IRDPGPRHAFDHSPGVARRAAGTLEAEVLGILREASGPPSPGEVRQRVSAGRRGELSYSTIVTIVSRLHDKGMLGRQRAGRGFTYTPVDEASLAASRMSQALGSGIDRDAVLSRFVSGLSGRDARLLRRLLTNGQEPMAGRQRTAARGRRANCRRTAAGLPRRLPPSLLPSAAVALAGCSTAALALLAGFAAARVPALAELGNYSQSVMRRVDPIPASTGALAALALTGAAIGVAVIFRNRARALGESYRRAAGLDGLDGLDPHDSIVVVPGPAIEAYALPGRPGRSVVSGGLIVPRENG